MSLEMSIEKLAEAINNHANAVGHLARSIKESGFVLAPTTVSFGVAEEKIKKAEETAREVLQPPADKPHTGTKPTPEDDKPKRTRRTKAEIEAEKAAEVKEEVKEEEEKEEEPEEPAQEEVEEEEVYYALKKYELSDIQKALMKIAAKGDAQRQAAKGIPLSMGYAKSADVPKEKYAEMVKGIYTLDKEVAEAVWGKR